jgi:predicted ATPase/class 3 adenylate cyclase
VVTLLFTDIEGSTRLLERLGARRFAAVVEEHRTLLRSAFARHRGYEVDAEGDAFFVAFASPEDAAAAAEAGQRLLAEAAWPEEVDVRVRMGLHTGEPLALSGRYVGLEVHQAARIMAAGHGGQVLLSSATRRRLAPGRETVPLGEHRLKDLLQPVPLFQLVVPGLPSVFPPLRTLGNRPSNLPVQRDPLIGRETEIADVTGILRETPTGALVTLTGPGGTGKTRLALHVAAELADHELATSGTFFVPLANVTDPSAVLAAIAGILALRAVAAESPAELLAEHLSDKRMLLVLDNLEQVVDAGATLARLLDHCPGLSLLVTSRVRLRVRGEQVYDVPPLSLPATGADGVTAARSDAVTLFTARAAAGGGGSAVTAETVGAVAEICRRLDGLPLAIELAAAWTPTLPVPALLRRLDRALPLLVRGAADTDHRQRTLRATIEWSYRLLDEAERLLFARLAVFVDGCRLDAAETVCADERLAVAEVLPGLAALVDKNLLRRRSDPDGEPRLWMLQTIREFAAGALDDDARVRERHAEHYLTLVASLPGAHTTVREEELSLLLADRANIQAAFVTAQEQGRYDRIGAAVPKFYYVWNASPAGQQDGLRWSDVLLAHGGELSPPVRLSMLMAVSEVFRFAGQLSRSRQLKEEAINLGRRHPDLIEAEGIRTRLAGTFASLADIAMDEGRLDDARRLIEESAQLGAGHRALAALGSLALFEGDLDAAERFLLEAQPGFEAAGDVSNRNVNLNLIGNVYWRKGDWQAAEEYFVASLRGFVDLAHTNGIAAAFDALAALDADRGDLERAGTLFGAAQAHGSFKYDWSEVTSEVAARLPPGAVAAGRAMTLEKAVAYALDNVSR